MFDNRKTFTFRTTLHSRARDQGSQSTFKHSCDPAPSPVYFDLSIGLLHKNVSEVSRVTVLAKRLQPNFIPSKREIIESDPTRSRYNGIEIKRHRDINELIKASGFQICTFFGGQPGRSSTFKCT